MNNTFLSKDPVRTQASHTTHRSVSGSRLLRQMSFIVLILLNSGLLTGGVGAEERARPIRIGALTPTWGPTPDIVGLRDGLVELGYRENEQFVIGVRFTQGDVAALPAAAREL